MLGSSGEWKSSPREINGGSETFPSHVPNRVSLLTLNGLLAFTALD